MNAAEARYAQLEEELHLLVSLSNSRLERLSALRKVRELEGELDEVGAGAAFPQLLAVEEMQIMTGLPWVLIIGAVHNQAVQGREGQCLGPSH